MASPSCSVATEEEAERGKPHTLSIKSNYYCTGCLVSAINCMLQDSAFSLDTERVREGLDAAKKTKAWVLHNRKEGQFFEQQLTKFLKKCFSSGVSTNAAREMVWGHYHKLRSSPAFRSLWKILLTLVVCSTTDDPIFMQYITHHNSLRKNSHCNLQPHTIQLCLPCPMKRTMLFGMWQGIFATSCTNI